MPDAIFFLFLADGYELAELEQMGVHVARNVPAKPSVRAFEGTLAQVSARLGLRVKPESAAMIGDKTSTDGGSALAGIDFIEVGRFQR